MIKNLLKKVSNRDLYLNLKLFQIVKKNRSVLKTIDSFIDSKDLINSIDKYGLTEKAIENIDKKMGYRLSYIDLLSFFGNTLFQKNLVYVEIGVSVLKNFYCLANQFQSSQLYAFDINRINSVVESKFKIIKRVNKSTVQYKYNSNEIFYTEGNVYEKNDFEYLKLIQENKPNLIFSDADHTKEGILSEYYNYYSNFLDDQFIIYFDDINSILIKAFIEISEDLKKTYKNVQSYTFAINGWLGKNVNQHRNGIITNIDIVSFLKKNRIKLKNFTKEI